MARLAVGRMALNPAVGAVVARDDRVVGRGWTRSPGGRHAEVVAWFEVDAATLGGMRGKCARPHRIRDLDLTRLPNGFAVPVSPAQHDAIVFVTS